MPTVRLFELLVDARQARPRAPAAATGSRAGTLERLFARGDAHRFDCTDWLCCLRLLFALPANSPLPLAAMSVLGEGIAAGDHYWLRLDPVHLHAGRTHLILQPLPAGDLDGEESATLRAALAPHLATAGYELVVANAERWYLRCPRPLDLETHAPSECGGVLAEAMLPRGADGAFWRRLLTEAQMLLHDLPVNQAREAAGKASVNAVWAWGGGAGCTIPPGAYSHVYSDDSLVRGLAAASGAHAAALPGQAHETWQGHCAPISILTAVSAGAIEEVDVEHAWARPLAAALSDERIEELRLTWIAHDRALHRRLRRRQWQRWWRRARPLSADA